MKEKERKEKLYKEEMKRLPSKASKKFSYFDSLSVKFNNKNIIS